MISWPLHKLCTSDRGVGSVDRKASRTAHLAREICTRRRSKESAKDGSWLQAASYIPLVYPHVIPEGSGQE